MRIEKRIRGLLARQSCAALCLGLLAVLAAPGSRTGAAAGGGRVELVKTPDGGIQPQAVVDRHGALHLVYLKGNPRAVDVFYTRREPGRERWSEPVRVNSEPGSAVAIGTIRGAQLAAGKGGRIHVAWNGSSASRQKGPLNSAPMLYARLNYAGTGFEQQRSLMRHTFALDGGGSVAADAAGNVYVAWHGASQTGGPSRGEAARRVWVARSADEGRTFSPEAPAWEQPTGACACCGLKIFADSRGALYLLYRGAAAGVDRDLYLLTSRSGGESLRFQGTRLDRWKVAT